MTNLEKTILDTISYFEGTLGKSQNGFDILFGGKKVMNGWTHDTTQIRHRCIKPYGNVTKEVIEDAGFTICEDQTWFGTTSTGAGTTAAGRYQYLGYSWASTTEKLGLGFNAPMSADNQNKAALRGVKLKRKVTEDELKKALTSIDNFKKVLEKLKNEWTSMKGALNKTYHKTVEMGWEFYKGAYEKYNSPNSGTQSNSNTPNGTTIYVDDYGVTIPKFGTSKTSSNTTDSDKYYINIPSDTTAKNIIFFWCGYETVISREKQWKQIPNNIKQKNYIIMGNYAPIAEGTARGDINGLRIPFKKYFTSIGGNYSKITTKILMGYSAGGVTTFNNYGKNDKLCALIDPSLSTAANTENRDWSSNVAMLWGSSGMIGISDWATRYPKVADKIKDGKGVVTKVASLDHAKAIEKWFQLYGSIILGNSSSANNSSSAEPNAGKLRMVMANLKIKEKIYSTAYTVAQIKASSPKSSGTGPNYIVPTKDPNKGDFKVLLGQNYRNGELSNGGDIDSDLVTVAQAVFNKIYADKKVTITVTGGNDNYHQSYNNNSKHKVGKGLDFVISPRKTQDLNYVVQVIKDLKSTYPNLGYIDEYRRQTANGTGDHFHLSVT